jgi:hypothetical protein
MRIQVVAIAVVRLVLEISSCGHQSATPRLSASSVRSTPLSSPPAPSAISVYADRCTVTQLRLGIGRRVSEPTGQHTLSFELTNRSSAGCRLDGYPGVALLDATSRSVPFEYTDGGDQVVTSKPPSNVDLAPGGIGYVTINKYRCDAGDVSQSARLRLTPPDDSNTIELPIPVDRNFAYCGTGDPGSMVYVSPVEPNFIATIQTN